ncbi:MAG: DUF6475 domain-containing protein [Desulfobacteraceae bacterium]
MDDADRQKFCEIMIGLAENVSAEITDFGLEMRFNALKSFSIDEINSAATAILKTWVYTGKMPPVAEFIKQMGGGEQNLSDVADLQATKVLEHVKRIGGYASVDFDDHVTKSVIQNCFGGWEKLCTDLKSDEEKWFLKDFAKYYQAYSRQNIRISGHLPGRHETKNNAIGMDEKPRIEHIGDTIKRLQIGSSK